MYNSMGEDIPSLKDKLLELKNILIKEKENGIPGIDE